MGQKVSPVGFRLGYIHGWEANWFLGKKGFAAQLLEDEAIRVFLMKLLPRDLVSKITIERRLKAILLTVHTSRPGVLIGPGGGKIMEITKKLRQKFGHEFHIGAQEVKKADQDAQLVAEQIASQIKARVMYKRAIKQVISAAMRSGAQGIKVRVSGRLAGAEIARTESYKEGRVPLHTLRADISHAHTEALTVYGKIGITVSIFLGEVYGRRDLLPVTAPTTHRNPKRL